MDNGVCHFTDFLDCYRLLYRTDQEGGLPLMEDVSLWNEARYPMKVSPGGHTSFNQKQTFHMKVFCERQILQSNQPNSQRKAYGSKEHIERGGIGTGAQRYGMQHRHTGFHRQRDLSRLRGGYTLQVGYNSEHKATADARSEHASPSVAHTGNLTDDDFSLQHWLISRCNKEDDSLSNCQRRKATTDARELRSSKPTEARKASGSTMCVCDLLLRDCTKKRKLLTLRDCSQLSPQNVDSFCRLCWSARHYQGSHGLCSSLCSKQPRLLQQEYATNRPDGHNQYEWLHQNLKHQSLVSAFHRSQKYLIELLRVKLLSLQEVNIPFSLDELDVSELPRGGKREALKRFTGKTQRKTLPNSPILPGLSIRRGGSSRAGKVKIQCRLTSECRLEVQHKREKKGMVVPTESLAHISNNQTLKLEGSVKDTGGFTHNMAPNRQNLKDGSRIPYGQTQEEDGLFKFPSQRSKAPSLSQKYRPKVLQDLVGQSLVAHALSNAISKDKVAPVYLFQGSPGTGKTSAARIFSMALNCFSSGERKPCGLCGGCVDLIFGKAPCVWELDAASYSGRACMHEFIESIDFYGQGPRYKVVIIEECHLFSLETWSTLMKFFEEPPANAVFILITTEPDKLPLSVVSRCQRFHFLRINHSDVVNRLKHITKLENLLAEPGALSLIASKSDGSLRDAETVLDQASLLEQKITSATVHNLVGSVSDENLMSLLDLALRSDVVSTVQKTREIMGGGVDPLDLIAQLATLITDILAGSYVPMEGNGQQGCLSMQALSDFEMERLRTALRILSEAERQLREVSLYRATWVIAALLQLGPPLQCMSEATSKSKSFAKANHAKLAVLAKKRHGSEAVLTDKSTKKFVNATSYPDISEKPALSTLEGNCLAANDEIHLHLKNPSNVGQLWLKVVKCCTPLSLRQLLQNHGKLLALSFSKENIVAHVVFDEPADKTTAEMHRLCILNSLKKVLGPSVDVQFSLISDLCGGGFEKYSTAAAADALWAQFTARHSAGHEVPRKEQGSFRSGSPRIQLEILLQSPRHRSPEISGQPPEKTSDCSLVVKAASCTRCRRKNCTIEELGAKSTIQHLAAGCCWIQPSTDLGGSNCFKSLRFKKEPRRNPWRLVGGFHARQLLCDCVVTESMNDNSTKADSLKKKTCDSLIALEQLSVTKSQRLSSTGPYFNVAGICERG